MDREPNEPLLTVYALRIPSAARADIEEGRTYVEAESGARIAELWEDGLFDAIGGLATLPYRYAAAPEARAIGLPLRGFSYRRPFSGSSAPAYRVLYLVDDGASQSGEGPTVTVLMVRHGARRPLTHREGRERRRTLDD